MLRGSKFRVASPGNAFCVTERKQWQRQITSFFASRSSDKAGDNNKPKRREEFTIPRLASFDWLVAVDNSLRWGTGQGLERFAETVRYLLQGEAPPTMVFAVD